MLFIYAIVVAIVSVHYQLMLESNRLVHLVICLLLTYFAKKLDQNYVLTIIMVFSIGIAKEMSDPVFDWMDILANSIGIIIGIML